MDIVCVCVCVLSSCTSQAFASQAGSVPRALLSVAASDTTRVSTMRQHDQCVPT